MKLLNYLARFFFSTKYRARREAMDEHDFLVKRIQFAGTTTEVYILEYEVMNYHDTWQRFIDYETLSVLVNSLWGAISERELALKGKNTRHLETIYN